ncbi:hypothetical protein O181_075446 [Austropuccinia psidii MF-1]|uniref:Uncharacterized protein n=1 Tax=Austropuccinia psidii MF-1 TaxID=1389203 RepID=A0A9Q3FEM7_9BASI|nr:hypothetical protein [Austropuccinia psidii MF-1]
MGRTLRSVGAIGGPLGPILLGTINWPMAQFSPTWPGPIERVQDHQDPGLPKVAGEALGDEFSPKGVLNLHLRGFEEGVIELWPHFLEVSVFDLKWTDSDIWNFPLGYFLVMSSKLTELTESSPSATPPPVLCGSGVLSQLVSPSMASSGHFDPSQTYDSYKAVELLDPACIECLAKVSKVRRYLWSRKDGPFGKEFPVSEAPTPDGTSGFSNLTGSRQRDVSRWTNVEGPIPVGGRPRYSSSEFPISRINTDSVVKRIRRIADFSPDPDAEGSDEVDGKKVEGVPHLVGHQSSTSSSQPLANRFHSHIIPSNPRTFQPTLTTIPTSLPPASPSPSHARPALNPEVRPSPIQKPRNSPITTSQHL